MPTFREVVEEQKRKNLLKETEKKSEEIIEKPIQKISTTKIIKPKPILEEKEEPIIEGVYNPTSDQLYLAYYCLFGHTIRGKKEFIKSEIKRLINLV